MDNENRIDDLKKEYERKLKDQEQLYKKSYAMEVEKRRYFEERYYLSKEEKEELELLRVENDQLKNTLTFLTHSHKRSAISIASMSALDLVRQRIRWKRENKHLLAKPRDYWKPVFDAEYYADHNLDIKQVYGTNEEALLRHFICLGMIEGRRAIATFDVNVYMCCNPDVVEKWMHDTRAYYLHYIEDGLEEGRRAV